MIESYPLYWPEGRPRTSRGERERSRFDTSFARARDEVVRQVELMTGRYEWMRREAGLILSTNMPLRRDGLPLASARPPDDPGVAVYFNYKGNPVCFACDRWLTVADNMQAIAKTIDALRGISRWGTGDMMEAAFKGFTALPAPTERGWRDVLGLLPGTAPTRADIESAFRRRRSETHPDRGGNSDEFHAVQAAYQQALKEVPQT
ncbi:J domain-containing protein [Flagellatimonas centrodinii]|uniref:J domain-containing protein n=1 Tax=Flagellatimonas centrodinii TaxID=2806210 RepID=UPI001FF01DAE|nr:J domain-containing protein [Flagellatimonas centrodinii]ULQ45839.1 J domain-containing protein [Flagellatimonas centrodinii]